MLFIGYYKYLFKPKPGSLSDLLDRFSRSIGNGFTVIQVGANDGITHDPIHKFIKRDRWTGVLLEPQKDVFEQKLSKLYRKHPEINAINCALGDEDGSTNIYKIGFSTARWATGLASFNRAHLLEAFESGHVIKQAAKEGITIPEDTAKYIVAEKVKVLCPETILSKYNLSKIDMLQIDAEGFDFEVVKLFKIDKTNPKLVCFESSHLSKEEYAECH